MRAAYSSGHPALGVGAGNTPAVIDETADVQTAVSSILLSKASRRRQLGSRLAATRRGVAGTERGLLAYPARMRTWHTLPPPTLPHMLAPHARAPPALQTFDNGVICASEQSVVVVDSVYDKVREELVRRGCYFLKDEEEKDKVGLVVVGGTRACWWWGGAR